MTRVLVAAAQDVTRAGLEALVASGPGLEVVGRSRSGPALAQDITTAQPDVVLLELGWQRDDLAWDALLPANMAHPPALVVLSEDAQGAWLTEALRAGVQAVLPREATTAEIIAAIQAAALGLVVLPEPTIRAFLAVQPAPARAPLLGGQTLTAREIEVLGMLAEGLGNKMIARQLGISDHTVKFHVGSILTKLNAASRTEAVTIGARQGLIML